MPDRELPEGQTACFENCPFTSRNCFINWANEEPICENEVDRMAILLQKMFPDQTITVKAFNNKGLWIARGNTFADLLKLEGGVWKKMT